MGNRRCRGSAQFIVAGLAMMSRQLPARLQNALSVSQLATSSSVCYERCVMTRRALRRSLCVVIALSHSRETVALFDQLTTRTSMWCPRQVVDVCCISGLVLFALPHESCWPKFVGTNALSLPGVNMDGACIIFVRTCCTFFCFF